MSHNGNTYFYQVTHLRQNLLTTLKFKGIGMRDLHYLDGVGNSLRVIDLICAERHIHNYQGALNAANH